MQLYVGPCHVISAEIAVAMAVLIENPADCEVRGVIRFLPADEILGYLAEEASSRVELFCCTSAYCPTDTSLAVWTILLGHLRASSVQSGPGTVWLYPFFQKWSILLVNASQMMTTWTMLLAATWHEEGIHKLVPRYDKCLNVKGDYVEK